MRLSVNQTKAGQLVNGVGWCRMRKPTLILCAIVAVSRPCMAATSIPDDQAILAIIGEAEGEPYKGKVAVAEVIRRRGSLKGVYGIRAKRVVEHLYSQKTYEDCRRAWIESASTNYSLGATHWEGTAFPVPYWAKTMTVTVIIGHQRFYK